MVAQDLERVHCVQETIYQEILHGSSGFWDSTLCSRNNISGHPVNPLKSTLCSTICLEISTNCSYNWGYKYIT